MKKALVIAGLVAGCSGGVRQYGDLNNDGTDDSVTMRKDKLVVRLGVPKLDGGVKYASSHSIRTPGIEKFSMRDVNGDGNLDLLVDAEWAGPGAFGRLHKGTYVFFGKGDGIFQEPETYKPDS